MLWNHILFWHENVSSVSCKRFFTPTEEQCSDYFSNMKLSYDEMEAIEAATQGQADNDLWLALIRHYPILGNSPCLFCITVSSIQGKEEH